jgi:hypothetical protein
LREITGKIGGNKYCRKKEVTGDFSSPYPCKEEMMLEEG